MKINNNADFGLSKCFSTKNPQTMTEQIGTPLYKAPELIKDEKYGPEVDVYAFGILAYEIVTGKTPYYDVQNKGFKLLKKIVKGLLLKQIILKMLMMMKLKVI